jgi:hypothetical protein
MKEFPDMTWAFLINLGYERREYAANNAFTVHIGNMCASPEHNDLERIQIGWDFVKRLGPVKLLVKEALKEEKKDDDRS